jgi:hypothetical protein
MLSVGMFNMRETKGTFRAYKSDKNPRKNAKP